jgi:hypothetical protein
VAVLAVLLAGCTEKLDSSDAEAKLKDQLGARAKAVDCPGDIEVKTGKKFTCTLTDPSGAKSKLPVTIDDKGDLRVTVPAP